MKKIFKTIFIYLGVILLTLVAAVIFCGAFLFFYRDGNIFGIQYINVNEVIYARETANMDNIQVIEINSKTFDVVVSVNPNIEELTGAMRNKVFGYAQKSKAHANFSLDYNNSTKTATFTSTEPKGWLNKKDCYIEIAIPESWADKGYDIKIKTTKGDINVGGKAEWIVGGLTVDTGKGEAHISNVTIKNSINLKTTSGEMYVDEKCKTPTSIDATLNLGSGKIDFTKINTENFILDVVNVESIKKGQIGILKATELVTDGNIGGGGKIVVNEVDFVDFASLDTNISINRIVKSDTSVMSRIKITGQGKVQINDIYSSVDISGYNGDIYVNSTMGASVLSANQGDIKVENAKGFVSAVTEYGNIDITFSDTALNYDSTNKQRGVMATTKNGHIIINGLQNGNIKATGSGRISLDYDKIVGDNVIEAQSGVVNIVIPNPTETSSANEFAFNLITNSEVNTDIKVGAAGSIGSVDSSSSGLHEYINIYNSATSTSNNLKVTSSTGIIKIRSRDLIDF